MGLTDKQHKEEMNEFVMEVYQKPVIFLISMIVVGAILDGFIGTSNTFMSIFASIGGVGFLVTYYAYIKKKMITKVKS